MGHKMRNLVLLIVGILCAACLVCCLPRIKRVYTYAKLLDNDGKFVLSKTPSVLQLETNIEGRAVRIANISVAVSDLKSARIFIQDDADSRNSGFFLLLDDFGIMVREPIRFDSEPMIQSLSGSQVLFSPEFWAREMNYSWFRKALFTTPCSWSKIFFMQSKSFDKHFRLISSKYLLCWSADSICVIEGKNLKCVLAEHYASSNGLFAPPIFRYDGYQYNGALFSPDDTWIHTVTLCLYDSSLENKQAREEVTKIISGLKFIKGITPSTYNWKEQTAKDVAELKAKLELTETHRQ